MKLAYRMMFLAGVFLSAGGVQGAETAVIPFKSASEPIGQPLPSDAPEPILTGSACADGKCAGKEKSGESHLGKFWHWLAYSPAKAPCDCKRPTPYRPPLYAWFPCNSSSSCAAGTCAKSSAHPHVTVAAKPAEEPLRMPEMPIVVRPTPLVPGSSSVMADKLETPAVMPSNYKMMQVIAPK